MDDYGYDSDPREAWARGGMQTQPVGAPMSLGTTPASPQYGQPQVPQGQGPHMPQWGQPPGVMSATYQGPEGSRTSTYYPQMPQGPQGPPQGRPMSGISSGGSHSPQWGGTNWNWVMASPYSGPSTYNPMQGARSGISPSIMSQSSSGYGGSLGALRGSFAWPPRR